ncbi:MAG: uroporphyrinogen decarboxylase family protein [Anaerolineales bacterium]|jgi:hypothetical protein
MMTGLKWSESQTFLANLFGGGEFQGHGFIIDVPMPINGLFPVGSAEERAELMGRNFEANLRVKELIDDDRVPCLHVWSGTEVFAEAYGAKAYLNGFDMSFALATVHSAGEVDALQEPDIFSGSIGKIFEIADRLVQKYGNDHPVRICDIQSPFDIAALVWEKSSFYMALYDNPGAVHRLLDKITRTLEKFVEAFRNRYENVNLAHHPDLWMPPEYGICLSEDEVGSISKKAFSEFCLPYLNRLSDKFGGIYIHCCAHSTHQWDNFLKINGLIGLNLNTDFETTVKSIEKFSGEVFLVPGGWDSLRPIFLESLKVLLSYTKANTRLYITASAPEVNSAKLLRNTLRVLLGRE